MSVLYVLQRTLSCDPSLCSFVMHTSIQLYLIDKTDVSWWSMRSKSGGEGLVPVNYIDKLDTDQEQHASDLLDGHTPTPKVNGGMDNGVSVHGVCAKGSG